MQENRKEVQITENFVQKDNGTYDFIMKVDVRMFLV